MMARRPRFARSATAKVLAAVLVGALVLVTAVLVFFAIDRANSTPPAERPDPVPTFSFAPQSTSTPAPSPSPSPSSSPTESPASLSNAAGPAGADARFLAVGADDVLWRATAGDCGVTAPLIERSADAGETWTDVTPRYRDIGEVVSLDAFAGVQAEMIAVMGDACEVQALRTFTQGEFWQPYPEVLAASRYPDPADAVSVVTPEGATAAPCATPQSFRAQGEVLALVCDGTAHRLADGEWKPLDAAGVRALAVAGATVLTAAETNGCSGLSVTRWSGADLSTATDLGCAALADPSAPLALAGSTSTALLWSGDELVALP